MAKDQPAEAEERRVPINRREFLNFAWLASLGFLSVSMGGMTFLFSMPRFREGEFGGTFTIGRYSDLPPAGSAPVNYPQVKLWLTNTPEGVVALYKVCTHLGCLYNWSDQEDKFICPCHGSQFEKDGDWIGGPAPRDLDRFVVRALDPQTGDVIEESESGQPLSVSNPDAVIVVDTGLRVIGEPHA